MTLRLAETLQYTVFINPHEKALQYFNLSALRASFCIETDWHLLPAKMDVSMSVKPLTVHSYEHMNRTFRGPGGAQLLPREEDPGVRAHHADVLLTFFAALFGHLQLQHLDRGELFLQQSLGGACQYLAIQKRHFEHNCAQLMLNNFKFDDFSVEDFDKGGSDWQTLRKGEEVSSSSEQEQQTPFHPLCNMTAEVVRGAQAAHGLAGLSSYVLLTDHQEPLPLDLQALRPIISSRSAGATGGGAEGQANRDDLVALDLFLGLHSALLVRNPYSSLSLPLELARLLLRPSLPTSSAAHSSNTSLLVLGRWFTMRDVQHAVRKKQQQQ